MPPTTLSELASRSRLVPILAAKSGAPLANAPCSMAYNAGATGAPAWPGFPNNVGTAAAGVLTDRTTTGALTLPPDAEIPTAPAIFRSLNQFTQLTVLSVLMDRVWHYQHDASIPAGALSLANPPDIPSSLRDAGLVWAIEISNVLAASAINITLTLEHEDLTTANVVVALPSAAASLRLFGIDSPNGKPIRRVIAASSSAANVGNFYITANVPGPIITLHANRRAGAPASLDPLTLGPVPWARRNPCFVPWTFSETSTAGGPLSVLEIGDLS